MIWKGLATRAFFNRKSNQPSRHLTAWQKYIDYTNQESLITWIELIQRCYGFSFSQIRAGISLLEQEQAKLSLQEQRSIILLLTMLLKASSDGNIRLQRSILFEKLRIPWSDIQDENEMDANKDMLEQLEADITYLEHHFILLTKKISQIISYSEPTRPLIMLDQASACYIQRFYIYEQRLIRKLDTMLRTHSHSLVFNELQAQACVEKVIGTLAGSFEINQEQKRALQKVLEKQLVVISGGPGTGKTATVVNILRVLLEYAHMAQYKKPEEYRIYIAAPTGRAATRIAESIIQAKNQFPYDMNIDACLPDSGSTLDKLLGMSLNNQYQPRYHEENPLLADIVLVDEASMVDLHRMTFLLEALPAECKLVLVGDKNQLPSVEAGAILSNLMPLETERTLNTHAMCDHVVELIHSYRSTQRIKDLAQAINIKNWQRVESILTQHSTSVDLIDLDSFCFIPFHSNPAHHFNQVETLLRLFPFEKLAELCQENFTNEEGRVKQAFSNQFETIFHLLNSTIFLSPIHGSEYGTERINQRCRNLANDSMHTLYPGLPLMITYNDYTHHLFNGDRGVVVWDSSHEVFRVLFRSNQRDHSKAASDDEFPFRLVNVSQLRNYEMAYAMTIHKSQGSEYERVVILASPESKRILTKETLYTAITRAKSSCILISENDFIKTVVEKEIQRDSGIRDFLVKTVS